MKDLNPGDVTHVIVMEPHVAAGEPLDFCHCPIALALAGELGALPGPLDHADGHKPAPVAVSQTEVCVSMPDGRLLEARTPQSAADFIAAFDAGLKPPLIEFDLTWREMTG